ncbi:RNB domain-containing protein [Entamoeba marina]
MSCEQQNIVRGLFQHSNNQYYCHLEFSSTTIDILIYPLEIGNAIHGDLVFVELYDLPYWRLFNINSKELVKHPIPHELFKPFFQTQPQNLLQCLEIMQPYDQHILIPVGKVIGIECVGSLGEITGYVEENVFFPDNHSLPILCCDDEKLKFHRVKGTIDREKNSFIVTSIINKIEYEQEVLMDDSETIYFASAPISLHNTPNITMNQLTYENGQQSSLRFDFRNRRTITIDRSGTRVRDDAIHIEVLNEKTIEIGVHCIDFTGKISDEMFLNAWKQNTNPQMHTLPDSILHQLSLNVGRESEAFTIIFDIDVTNGEISNVRFGKTIISIKTNLTFDQFDQVRLNDVTTASNILNREKISLINIDLNKLITDIRYFEHITIKYLKEFGKKTGRKSEKYNGSGDNVIQMFGEFINEFMGEQLFRTYHEYALLIPFYKKHITSFRSPFRKFFDICVIRQIEAMACGYDVYSMAKFVCGGEPEVLKTIQPPK